MSTPDHPDGIMPAWQAAHSPAVPTTPAWGDPSEAEPAQVKTLTARLIWRATRRHWWQILLVWTAASAGLMVMAYKKIKTSYDATAWLIIRSSAPTVFAGGGDPGDFNRYQKTQVKLVTSPDVLTDALAKHPELGHLPLLREADDPEAAIRRELRVLVEPETSLFTVSLSSESRDEAVMIVDAVVEAYLKAANSLANEEVQGQINRLKKEQDKLEDELVVKKERLLKLVEKVGGGDNTILKDQGKMSMERFNRHLGELDTARLRRIELQGRLDTARARANRALPKAARPSEDGATLRDLFYADPEVAGVQGQLERAQRKYDDARRIARSPGDPAVVAAKKQVDKLRDELDRMWRAKKPGLLKSRLVETGADEGEKAVAELQAQLEAAEASERTLQDLLKNIEVDNKVAGNEAFQLRLLQADFDRTNQMKESIENRVKQLDLEARGPARIDQAAKTRVDPSANKRMRVMAAAPIGVLLAVLGLAVLVEIRSGRISDPDDVAARARVEVLGVVPPLPSLRPAKALWGARDEFRARRDLEEFMQSLDHLRVALCASAKGGQGRRCVLITSACGSEGKTTLAAHLAGRCANAGLSTLVIDADLRKPSLSKLLKVPEGLGLSDVLRGEVEAEEAMMVIEAGGGFHLLPAGTPGYDPSRLLQGDQLAQLLSRARQTFDIVIVDAPPVLLVADALTVGRWTDGAVLAVRYDTSRFPLLERARRRLASVGVPVLGAVVNGVRTMESSYSQYAYSYSYSSHADRPTGTAIDVPAEPTA